MPGDSRRQFLAGLEALRLSLDSQLVSGSDAVGSFLRRGLTIVSYNLLESFISTRLDEIANYINSGLTHFIDLPDKLQRAATVDVMRFANSRMQRSRWDPASALPFMTSIGESLAASSGPLKLSPLTWQWSGSNMIADDLHRAMRLFHVASPWQTIEMFSNRTGHSMPDPKTTVESLLRERNLCAHESSYQVSNLWIRAVPYQLQVIGMGVDIAISVSAQEMHLANSDFFQDINWMSSNRIQFRYVQQRSRTWAEMMEGKTRAFRVGNDKDSILREAINRARGKHQIVVVQNEVLQPIDWIYPEVP